jgi:aspartyl aminopeptidase
MSSTENNETQLLKDKLIKENTRLWDKLTEEQRAEVLAYAEKYKVFLHTFRTERMVVNHFVERCKAAGFADFASAGAGPKVYFANRGKIMAVAVRGKRPILDGVRLITSHVDSPRLDLKLNPLYEDTGMAYLKTHYYGGVKKYHWLSRQLAICGTIVKSDGTPVEINIGLDPKDPVFTIPDLLPHLAKKQMEQKASDFVPAENLNVIVGSIPYPDKNTDDRVKLAILDRLNREFGITEEDLITAEIQIVPADPVRDAGLDRSFIVGYGQDDRICAYASLTAILEAREPELTAVAVFYDKEEIGSEGNTSAKSNFLEHFLLDLMAGAGVEPTTLNLHKLLANTRALSADVTAGVDPNFAEVHDKRNSAKMGYGIGFKKYTGHGGKYMASDANAEHASWVRRLFNKNDVSWQVAGIGKIDEGGGGTVAKFLANIGVDIIDCGPPLLGMHSPMEVSSKDDLWMCQKAFKVFFESGDDV